MALLHAPSKLDVDLSLLPGIWLNCFVVFADYGFDNNALYWSFSLL